MGAGKSTIGRQLADRMHKEFIDSDHEIESRTGAKIELIFEIEGEEGFRQREKQVIEELTARHNIVLATGGGVVLAEENRNYLKQRGRVIYLKAPPEKLLERTAKDQKRPLLQTGNRLDKIKELLQERELLYEEVADVVINTDGDPIKEITNNIYQALQEQCRR